MSSRAESETMLERSDKRHKKVGGASLDSLGVKEVVDKFPQGNVENG